MNSKLKKASIALAGIMSAVAIAGVVPANVGTGMATVAHAANLNDKYLSTNTVFNGDSTITYYSTFKAGENAKCVVVINGNVSVGKECYLSVCKGSTLIINGSVTLGNGAWFTIYDYEAGSRCIVTGTVTNNGGNLPNKGIVYTSLKNIGYVAASDDYYEHFTSDGKFYTFDNTTNSFVETTEAAVTKTKPATATYTNAGDYPAQFEGDAAASAWSVTVTPGSDTIEKIDVKVNGRGSEEGAWTDIPEITEGTVVFAVAVNLAADDVNSVTAVVNGSDVITTLE